MSNQQIYIPFGGRYPIPYEFEADRLPCAARSLQYSACTRKQTGYECSGIRASDAESWKYVGFRGNMVFFQVPISLKFWGKGLSRSYAQKVLASLESKELDRDACTQSCGEDRYKVRHHNCEPAMIPYNADGKPLTFSVPRGPGGPIERCIAGDISWKAALAWIVFKHRSNWSAGEETSGQTQQETLLESSRRCRMGDANFTGDYKGAGSCWHAPASDTQIASCHFPIVSKTFCASSIGATS